MLAKIIRRSCGRQSGGSEANYRVHIRLSIPLRIFIFAFAAYLVLALIQPRREWSSVSENSYVAASLASGQGFSSPYLGPPYLVTTGPSALVPPLSPYLLAGIFRIFGVLSPASRRVAVGLNILVHAISCVLLYWICEEIFGNRVARFAALGLAFLPLLTEPLVWLRLPGDRLFLPPNLIWNTHLTELAVLLLIWVTLRQTHSSVYGMVWGASALTNPTVLALVPAFWGWRMREKTPMARSGPDCWHLGTVPLALVDPQLCGFSPPRVSSRRLRHRTSGRQPARRQRPLDSERSPGGKRVRVGTFRRDG